MPINQLYDISVEETASSYGKCIHASEAVFRKVAGMLYMLATSKPDPSMTDELGRELKIDFQTQAEFFSFAMQCFSAAICHNEEGEDMPVYHRTKPTDDCVLQELQGDEWIDIFDFGACLDLHLAKSSEQEVGTKQIEGALPLVTQIWEKFNEKYTGTSGSYNPKLTISGGTADLNRAALCKAVSQTVRSYVAQSLQEKNQQVDNLGRAALFIGAGLAIMGMVAAILTFPVAAPLTAAFLAQYFTLGSLGIGSAVLGLNAAGLQLWQQAIKDTEIPVFQDDDAIRDIICILYTRLKDKTDISAEDFAESLDVSGESGNTQALWNAIKHLFEQPIAYPTFLELWLREIAVGESGFIEAACECLEPEIEVGPSGGHPLTGIVFEDGNETEETYVITGYMNGVRLGAAIGMAYDGGGVWLTSIEQLSGPPVDHVEWVDVLTGPEFFGHDSLDDIPTDREISYLGMTAEVYTGTWSFRVKLRTEE